MEKAFALKSAIPTLATNGKVAIYSTLDPNVTMIYILNDFEWENRKKEEVFRCPRCKTYIFPADKHKTKDGVKYHPICTFKEKFHDTGTRTTHNPNLDRGGSNCDCGSGDSGSSVGVMEGVENSK